MGSRISFPPLRVGERQLALAEPSIMGVVNVTPDSFSTGHTLEPEAAIAHGVALWRDGAAILDVGGEATNPRAAAIGAEEEWARIAPVLRGLAAATGAILSVDTTKAEVAARAVAAGATIVNDISGGRFDPAMIATVAELLRTHRVAYVAGHLRGRSISEVFSAEPAAAALTAEAVVAELAALVAALPQEVRDVTIVDPGLGFGKGAGDVNLALLRSGEALARATGRPVLMGPSRKRFLRRLLEEDAARWEQKSPLLVDSQRGWEGPASTSPREATRGGGTEPALPAQQGRESPLSIDSASVGACLAAVANGAHVVRIHAVALLRPALAVYIKK